MESQNHLNWKVIQPICPAVNWDIYSSQQVLRAPFQPDLEYLHREHPPHLGNLCLTALTVKKNFSCPTHIFRLLG